MSESIPVYNTTAKIDDYPFSDFLFEGSSNTVSDDNKRVPLSITLL